MNTPPDPEPIPLPRKHLRPKTLADELKALNKQIESLPQAERFVLQMPNVTDADEAVEHLRQNNYPIADMPSEEVLVAGEKLERARMFEAKAGCHQRLPVIAFFYLYVESKRPKTVIVKVPDGITPIHLLKAFFWGRVNEIPPPAVSQVYETREYFAVKPTTESGLVDQPRLAHELKIADKEHRKEIGVVGSKAHSAEKIAVQALERTRELEGVVTKKNAQLARMSSRLASLYWIRLGLGISAVINFLLLWRELAI